MMFVVAVFAVACNQQKDEWTKIGAIQAYDAQEEPGFRNVHATLYVKIQDGQKVYQVRYMMEELAVINNPFYGRKDLKSTGSYTHRAGHLYFDL